jgi:hypothetical protein
MSGILAIVLIGAGAATAIYLTGGFGKKPKGP